MIFVQFSPQSTRVHGVEGVLRHPSDLRYHNSLTQYLSDSHSSTKLPSDISVSSLGSSLLRLG